MSEVRVKDEEQKALAAQALADFAAKEGIALEPEGGPTTVAPETERTMGS